MAGDLKDSGAEMVAAASVDGRIDGRSGVMVR